MWGGEESKTTHTHCTTKLNKKHVKTEEKTLAVNINKLCMVHKQKKQTIYTKKQLRINVTVKKLTLTLS